MPGIGVGLGRRRFPLRGRGGQSWSSYWKSLISATVEQADQDAVVLTFPEAKALVASDFTCTIDGSNRAISSASWTGAVLTLVLASNIEFEDVVIVTFIKSGGAVNVINNITHPSCLDVVKTKGWYEYDKTDTITLRRTEGIDYLAELECLLGNDSFVQATEAYQPLYESTGIRTPAAQPRYLTRGGLNLPCTIYIITEGIAYSTAGALLGDPEGRLSVVQSAASPYGLAFWTGSYVGVNNDTQLGEEELITIIVNGANSSIQIDDHDPVNASLSPAASISALYLHILSLPTSFPGVFNTKYIIIRDGLDTAADATAIKNYLKKKS